MSLFLPGRQKKAIFGGTGVSPGHEMQGGRCPPAIMWLSGTGLWPVMATGWKACATNYYLVPKLCLGTQMSSKLRFEGQAELGNEARPT